MNTPLPISTVCIQVDEQKFELGKSSRFVVFDNDCDLFIEKNKDMLNFLIDQNPNWDVKIFFSFTKFGISYDFKILSNSVGHWVEQIPASSLELAQPYDSPVEKLNAKEFERLCFWLIDSDSNFIDTLWLNENGGGERGRDVIAVSSSTNEHYVFQCKHVEKFGPSEMENELNTFARYIDDDPSIKPDVYVLFISTTVTDKTKAKGDELAKQIGMKIKYWPKSKIDRRLRINDIVRERFWKIIK